MQAELKVVDGEVFGRPIENGKMMRLPNRVRSDFAGNPVEIAQWLDLGRMQSWIVLDRVATSMMISDYMVGQSECFWDTVEEDGEMSSSSPMWVVYENPVILHIPSLTSQCVRMMDRDGEVLAGTNIYDEGFSGKAWAICIGEDFDPLGVNVVELLLANEANTDLYWRGDPIVGEWKDNQFIIESWPTLPHIKETIPQQVLEDFDAWSRS